MNTAQLVAVAEELDTDDFADILQQLPETITNQVLESLDSRDRARVESVLSYPEDSASGQLNTDATTARPLHVAEMVLRSLRLRRELPATTDTLVVVNSRDEYLGVLPITKLLTPDPTVIVREIMNSEGQPIYVAESDTEVARLFAERDLISAAVVEMLDIRYDASPLMTRWTSSSCVRKKQSLRLLAC